MQTLIGGSCTSALCCQKQTSGLRTFRRDPASLFNLPPRDFAE